MTDTTDIAALRDQPDHSPYALVMAQNEALTKGIVVLQSQLEAERRRADRYHFVAMSALEAQAEISEQLGISEDECDGSPEQIHEKIEMLQTELAALKGNQVPFAYYSNGGYYNTERAALKDGAEEVIPLFTAPQKPVVLDDATVLAWGDRNYIKGDVSKLRCMIDDAASLPAAIEATGGIVKEGE